MRLTPRSPQAAQQLRLQRTLLGSLTYAFSALVAIGFERMDVIDARQLIPYVGGILIVNVAVLWALLSGHNLRLRDPSMTAPQVLVALAFNSYIMFHLQNPQARMAFLLLSTTGLMFALFALRHRQMLLFAGLMVGGYVGLLGALHITHPERINGPIEVVVVFAYAGVIGMIALLGQEMTRLRRKLKERNAQLEETLAELEQIALHDTLTQLPNRRAIMQELNHKMNAATHGNGGESFYIFLVDIDHFKVINDSYGHNCGDKVLFALSQTVARDLRSGDVWGRYGGEEFLLAFAPDSPEAALQTAERVRRRVAGLRLRSGTNTLRITASLGGAHYRPGEHIEATLERADQALYQAKREGRNRTVLYEDARAAHGYARRRPSSIPH